MVANAEWLNRAQREEFERTLTVSGAGASLLQTSINRVVQLLTLRTLGLQVVLDVKPGSGNAAYINQRTAGTTGGIWVADTTDGATAEETGTYGQTSFPFRTLLKRGTVTRALVAKGRSYGDVLGIEMEGAAEDYADQTEFGLISGDVAQNSNQINGLLTMINATSGQVVAQTTGSGGDAFTMAKLDATIDKVKGSGNRSDLIILASQLGGRKINAALQAQQRFNDMIEIPAGFRVKSYDGIPIITSTRMPDALTWSGSSITGLTGGGTTAIAVINRRFMWIEELTALSVMPLARTTSQNEAFDMFRDFTLVFANTKGAALLAGITTT